HWTVWGGPKRGFATRSEAEEIARRVMAGNWNGERLGQLSAYQCCSCGQWHVGNNNDPRPPYDVGLTIELGERAVGNLLMENTRTGRARLNHLKRRGRKAEP